MRSSYPQLLPLWILWVILGAYGVFMGVIAVRIYLRHHRGCWPAGERFFLRGELDR